ncbi:MAG TPA: Crp/Fnr family transcriptional regulator [Puia sp.]|nr:Crp/Fnr family transcriptional regulator [Puia sp.]
MERLFIELRKLHPVSQELENYLRAHVLKKLYRKKDMILKEGQICRYVYFIESGLVHHFSTKSGKRVTTWLLGEHHFCVSFESFFDSVPAEDNIQALENCIIWCITLDQLHEIFRLFPEFMRHVDLIKKKYRSIGEKIKVHLQGLGTKGKYLWFLDYHADISNRVPLEIIASYLGIAKNTLDRIRRDMAKPR